MLTMLVLCGIFWSTSEQKQQLNSHSQTESDSLPNRSILSMILLVHRNNTILKVCVCTWDYAFVLLSNPVINSAFQHLEKQCISLNSRAIITYLVPYLDVPRDHKNVIITTAVFLDYTIDWTIIFCQNVALWPIYLFPGFCFGYHNH